VWRNICFSVPPKLNLNAFGRGFLLWSGRFGKAAGEALPQSEHKNIHAICVPQGTFLIIETSIDQLLRNKSVKYDLKAAKHFIFSHHSFLSFVLVSLSSFNHYKADLT
jgi:hypothetical protein